MNNIIKGALSASIAAGAIALTSCGDKLDTDSKKVLVLTAIPDKNSSDQTAKFKPLTDYLSEKLGVEVKYRSSNSYSTSVQSFVQGETQLVWFGGVTGVQAREKVSGSVAIAQGVIDPKYKSYFIAHKDTGLTKSDTFPKSIANMSFSFGDPSSTSGRVMPTYFITQETGKSPEEFFSEKPRFAGKRSHAGVANDVQSGAVQAGVMSYSTYNKMVKKGELDTDLVKIIWETPDYYDYNFTAHPSLAEKFDKGFIDKLQKVLIECKDKDALECINRADGLISAKNDDFNKIIEIMKEIDFEAK